MELILAHTYSSSSSRAVFQFTKAAMISIIWLSTILLVSGTPLPDEKTSDGKSFSYILEANRGVNNLLDGDIVDSPRMRKEIEHLKNGKFIGYDAQVTGKWPNGVVPYTYGTINDKGKTVVEYAIREYNAKTCIRFVKRTNEVDYISFEQEKGCHSLVGRNGGRQVLSIGKGCERNYVAIHEMMHAIGFYHEQSRRDRDQYITINYSNVPQDLHYAFDKYANGIAITYGEPYDKQSVMHYDRYAFAVDRKIPTITSKTDKNEVLGNFVGFTQIDINQINKHYNCATNPNTPGPITKGPNTMDPKTKSPTTWQPPIYTTLPPHTLPPKNCKDDDVKNCPYFIGDCRLDYIANYCKKTCNKCT